jgi:uncharacterized YigZ family protein
MLELYRTVSRPSRIELTERKSRFIAFCRPLSAEIEAVDFINGARREFPDAAHHVYAWVLGGDQNLQRYSDDGEPQGTAGMPVLDALQHSGIIQAGIVVVRYFGGILLGSGGLVRAYGRAAALSMAAAVPVTMQLCEIFKVTISYASLDRLRRQLALAGALLLDNRFELDAELVAAIPNGRGEFLRQACADATGGAALIEPAGLAYQPVPPPDFPPAGSRPAWTASGGHAAH